MQVTGSRRAGRVALAIVALATFVAVPAVAQEPATGGIGSVCPPPEDARIEEPPVFPDRGTVHGEAITCAGAYGLVTGFADGTYRPGTSVTRGQMATFVDGWLRVATDIPLPTPDEVPFDDIDDSVHAAAIGSLAAVDIVGGRPDGSFGPGEPLTRGQFARIMGNAISYADVFAVGGPLPPPGDGSVFTDVVGTTFEAEIGAIAGVGITVGDADGSFRPNADVTRGQLATFLMRSANYLERHQRWYPTATVTVQFASLSWRSIPPEEGSDDEFGGLPGATGTAVLSVNAFNGTLAYTLDLSDVSGPYHRASGATVHLGGPGESGPVVLTLADGTTLAAAKDDVVTGVVLEADSAVRFADLVHDSTEAYVLVATNAYPDGAVRGQLVAAQ